MHMHIKLMNTFGNRLTLTLTLMANILLLYGRLHECHLYWHSTSAKWL